MALAPGSDLADVDVAIARTEPRFEDHPGVFVLIDLNPLGANVPSVGYNTSGTAINANTPSNLALAANQITWNLTGPVFPTASLDVTGPHAGHLHRPFLHDSGDSNYRRQVMSRHPVRS